MTLLDNSGEISFMASEKAIIIKTEIFLNTRFNQAYGHGHGFSAFP